jgi:DNA (cytosine-5)-methyltransferase 1
MKYISICSGIEAASVAWEGFGWTPLAFSEIEAFPSTVLAHHYPGVPNLGDMTKFEDWPEEILAECDILVGGPPCQAFSVAGLRKSLQDERGNVTLAYVRLLNHIDEVRRRHGRPPVIAVYENVPGLLSTKDNAFGCLIGALCGCDEAPETETGKWPKAGFLCGEARRVGYRVLDAQFFGVAQRRRRIFLIAVPCELVERLGERACPSEILSLRESMRGNPPTRGAKGEGVTSATPISTRTGRSDDRGDGLDNIIPIWRGGDQANSEHCIGHAGKLNCDKGQQGGIVAFHPTQDPISSEDGSVHAIGTGLSGGCATAAVAFKPGQSEAAGGTFVTEEFAPTIQGQSNGSTAVPAVAFKPSYFTRGKDGKPSEVTPPLSADADKGDQDTVIATPFTKSKRDQSATDDESWVPGEVAPTFNCFDQGDTRATTVVAFNTWGGEPRSDRPNGGFYVEENAETSKTLDSHGGLNPSASQGGTVVAFTTEQTPKFNDDCALTMTKQSPSGGGQPQCVMHPIAFTQNTRDEVRQINGDGQLAGALSAEAGMHQTNYVAFANRTRDGIKVPEVMKDGVTPALLNPGGGGRSDAVNVVVPQPMAFAQNQLGEVRTNGEVMGTVNTNQNASGRNTPMVQQAMSVRRLTPQECERLQGFPDDYTAITYRNKPAADGPRYKALGNSMAVPCMWWIGMRIVKATEQE